MALPDDGRSTIDDRGRDAGPWIAVFLPLVVALAVGVPAVNGTFIRDDWDYVSGNPHVVCKAGLRDILKSPFQPLETLGLYRPVTTLSLRLDAWLGGEEKPWIFHATNLLLAGLSAALVAMLAGRLVLPSWGRDAAVRAALVAGLLFAVHPARTEAVCWVSGRAECLMTLFSLLCLLMATGPAALWRTVAAAVCAALAAGSKEQGFMLGLLVPILAPPVTGKRLVQAIVVGGALGLAFVARWGALASLRLVAGTAVFENLGLSGRIAQGLLLLFEYARITVWPHPLSFEYDAPSLVATGFGDRRVLLGALTLVALVAAMVFGRRRQLVAAGAALFLLPLVPVLQVFLPIGEDLAERFLALPIAGAALLAAWVAVRFPRAGFGAAMLAAAAGGAAFTMQAAHYRSERELYEQLLVQAPASPTAKSLVASTLLLPNGGQKQPPHADTLRAEALLREVVAANPGLAPARVTLATLRAQQRAPVKQRALPQDVELMEETARRFPDLPTVHGMLGAAFLEHGVRERARQEFERELEVMPYDTIAASHLVRIYEEEKETKKVDALLEKLHERWKALWQRFPGFGPVAVTYARTLADGGRDVDGARAVLRKSLEAACRPADRKMIEAALAELR